MLVRGGEEAGLRGFVCLTVMDASIFVWDGLRGLCFVVVVFMTEF